MNESSTHSARDNREPNPIVIIIKKKNMHQIHGKGISDKASGYTRKKTTSQMQKISHKGKQTALPINDRPGPPTANSLISTPVFSLINPKTKNSHV
jgi:hypothetical protein